MEAATSPPSRQYSRNAAFLADLLHEIRGVSSSVSLREDCLPAGDPQRTWFPEMIQKLRAEWHVGMSFPEDIELCDSLDSMLRDLRFTRKIRSPLYKCPRCGHTGPGG